MRKVIAAINMTIDGYCDHTAGIVDEELHDHYTQLLGEADVILYGRKTYELMQYWQTLLKNPSGEKSMDDFAVAIDRVPKIVFSRSLKETGWNSAQLASRSLVETINELKQQQGKNIFIGSRSLIIQLMNLNLIDELQLCIQSVVAPQAELPLFENVNERTVFKLNTTKVFNGGAIVLYYQPERRMGSQLSD